MRLVTFQHPNGPPRLGALHGDNDDVVDLAAADAGSGVLQSMRSLMSSGARGLERAQEALDTAIQRRQTLPRSSVRLLSPLGHPTLIRDFATMETHMRNYLLLRATERSRDAENPTAYILSEQQAGKLDMPKNWLTVYQHHIGNPLNTIGPDDTLTRPVGVQELDYELELAAVIGKTVRDVDVADAGAYIFGYTLMNDFTARDIQREEGKAAGKSKDFDGSYSLGPCIVTREAFWRQPDIKLRSRLNGQLQAEDSLSSMQLSFEQLLSYISRSCTVHAGEIFASGTFARGCGYELGRLLQDGDTVEIEADGIGTLRNQVRSHR